MRGQSGLKLWRARVRTTYRTLAELRSYNRIYGIAKRLGYRNALTLWRDNPMIGGSVNPSDFRIIHR